MLRVTVVDESSAEVVWRVHDTLSEEQVLRTTTADIEILDNGQSIVLRGRVRTRILFDLADRLARVAAGDWPVDNQLIDDERLTMQLSSAAGLDPRTASANVRFDVFLGVAHVLGVVQDSQQREAILELAAGVPGLVRVEDQTSLAR